MIKDFLHKLNEDCSNIDEVYSQLLKKYNPDNITKTEITFIDSIQYDKVKNNSNKISVISNYLGKKNSKGKMYDIDYYNHYINYKRFCFEVVRKQYDKNEFEDVVNRLDKYLSRYQYIFNRLENIKKVEFKQDTIDHLKNISEQEHSKYEIVFTDSLKRIENDFCIEPRQIETNKPDEVKNQHNNIFKYNGFVVWESMFVKFKIIESNYSANIDFMFEVMKYNNLIHENIGLTDIKNWINKVYEISFEKIKYTNPKSKANDKRLIIYNDIISK